MNKKVIISICVVVLILIMGVFVWTKVNNTFDKSNPIIFEQQINDDYISIIYKGKEYVPYSSITSKEREKYLGYVGEDKQDEIYNLKDI